MDKEDEIAFRKIISAMLIPLFGLLLVFLISFGAGWNVPEDNQIIKPITNQITENYAANQTVNRTVKHFVRIDQPETNNRTAPKSFPIRTPEQIPVEKKPLIPIRVDGCSQQDKNIMIGFRLWSDTSETLNISLYLNGRDVLENPYNRPIGFSPFQKRLVNTYIDPSVSLIEKNNGIIVFDVEIKKGIELIDKKIISCSLSGGGGGSISAPPSAPAPISPIQVLDKIIVIPSNVISVPGNTVLFTATGHDQFGKIMNVTFDWSSSALTVGTINESGAFIALESGNTTITASSGNISGTAAVLVEPLAAPNETIVPTPTLTPAITATPVPTLNVTATPTPTVMLTPNLTFQPTVAPTPNLTATSTPNLTTVIPTPTITPTSVPTETPEVSPSPTYTPAPNLSCSLVDTSNNKVVIFNGKYIRSDRTVDWATNGPYDLLLKAGIYNVTLVSFDSHSTKHGQMQINETWKIILLDKSGKRIGNTSFIGDLPDDRDWKTELVNVNLTINETVYSVTAMHAAYLDNSSPNSITPVCFEFSKIKLKTENKSENKSEDKADNNTKKKGRY